MEKAMTLREGGDANDSFFLAMAHWQLGGEQEARKWYDQAVRLYSANLGRTARPPTPSP